MPEIRSSARKSRTDIFNAGCGILAESAPRDAFEGNSALVTQALYGNAVGLMAGDIVQKIVVWVGTAGSGLTLVRLGIYDTAGVLLASSADNKANFAPTNAFVETALSANYTVPADGVYYLAILCVGTTPPTLQRNAAANNFFSTAVTGGVKPSWAQTGQADLPAPATPAVNSTATLWIAAMGTSAF